MMIEAKFEFGKVVATRGVTSAITEEEMNLAMIRYVQGDWGDLDESDKKMNDDAVKNGDNRILASYKSSDGTKFWLITEADRSITTFLLPSEY